MTHVLAAIDDNDAAASVLAGSRAFADLFQVQARALHVRSGHVGRVRALSRDAGIPLEVVEGEPIPTIRTAFADPHVVTGVIGTRSGRARHPAGYTVLTVINSLDTPVLAVPPSWRPGHGFRVHRVLVPLDASHESSSAVRRTVRALRGSDVQIVVLHVFDPDHVPAFSDQPQHELPAWGEEFLARYAETDVELDLRRGQAGHNVVECISEQDADALVLGWSRDLSPGRALVVREALRATPVPVLLLPAAPARSQGEAADHLRTGRAS